MPRKDFDKFLELAPSFFKHPYFLQTPITEKGNYYRSYAKLCNSETTGCSPYFIQQGVNGGIFIDVFVLDSIPDSVIVRNYYLRKIDFFPHFSRFISVCPTKYAGIKLFKHQIWRILWKLYGAKKGDFIFKKVHHLCRRQNRFKGRNCSFLASGLKQSEIFSKDWFAGTVIVPFEFLSVPIPNGYDSILCKQYGNYMTFPKLEERITHSFITFSTNTPYYLNSSKTND